MSSSTKLITFGLKNFKSFHDLDDIQIKPLTVLVGSNSVGKSSILQSLLLMKQTTDAERFTGVLRFEGESVKLTNYETVISNFDTGKNLEYRFQICFDLFTLNGSLYSPMFDAPTERRGKPGVHSIPISSTGQAEFRIQFHAAKDIGEPELYEYDLNVWAPPNVSKNKGLWLHVTDGGRTIKSHNLPNFRAIVPLDKSTLKSVTFDKFWPQALQYAGVGDKSGEARFMIPLNFVEPISGAINALKDVLAQQLEYLGPLRANPEPFYPVSESSDIDFTGKGTVPYLLRRGADIVRYSLSPMGDVKSDSLINATNEWLNKVGVTRRLTIRPVQAIAYVAGIESMSAAAHDVNLAQVGFGVSQLLPVIVMGLKNPTANILLLLT